MSLIDPKLPLTYHKKSLIIHGLSSAGFGNRRHGTEVDYEQTELLYDPYNLCSTLQTSEIEVHGNILEFSFT